MASTTMLGKVTSKAMLLLTILAIVGMPLFVKGGRDLKNVGGGGGGDVHPDNFFGGIGSGIYASPGGIGFPGVGTGSGVGVVGHGSALDFCSYPGLGCVRVEPTNPGSGVVGGVGATPLP